MKEFELEKIYNWQILSEKISQSGGGGGVWGTITGTLSDQFDLNAALNSKYPATNPAGYITNSVLITTLAPFLTSSVAAATYLTQVDASSTYLTQTGAASIYLTQANALSTYLSIANAIATYQPLLGFTPENVANKSIDGTLSANSDTLYASQKAVKTYIDASVTGVLDDRGNWDASVNLFPSTGGSGPGGAILKGDLWFVSVPGTLGGSPVVVGSNFRALVDSPGQIATNWNILNVGVGYTPENVINKSDSYTVSSTTTYANTKALVDGLATKVNTNPGIVAATKTKITYDAKGLVTAGADLATSDLPANAIKGAFGVGFFKGNSLINITDTATLVMPYSGTITGWEIYECSDTPISSSIVIDVWKDTYANYPPTIADVITGSEKPTLVSAIKNQDLNLTTWNTSFVAGDIFKFKVNSVSGAKNILLTIYCQKT